MFVHAKGDVSGSMKNANVLQKTRGEGIRRDHLVQWPDESNAVVVIDAENTSPRSIGFIQSHAERFGVVLFQFVLGNWSSSGLGGWDVNASAFSPRAIASK
jgi:hypothetical protein